MIEDKEVRPTWNTQLRFQWEQEQSIRLHTMKVFKADSFQRSHGRRFIEFILHILQCSLCPLQVLRTVLEDNNRDIWDLLKSFGLL